MLKYIFSKTKRFMGLIQSSEGIKLTLYIYIYICKVVMQRKLFGVAVAVFFKLIAKR